MEEESGESGLLRGGSKKGADREDISHLVFSHTLLFVVSPL